MLRRTLSWLGVSVPVDKRRWRGTGAGLRIAVLLLLHGQFASAAESAVAEWLIPRTDDVPSKVILRGGAQISDSEAERGLRLPGSAYAEWLPGQAMSTDGGTFTLWVQPLWALEDRQSHTFATFKWSGSDDSYFALSQGWWEPVGARKLYVVLSNQQFVFCFMPWTHDYTLYLPNQWTMLGVTWQSGGSGFLRLFVDGKRICERKFEFAGGRHAIGPVYLGSDRGATIEPRGRPANMIIKNIVATAHASSDEEMHSAYVRGGGMDRSKWMLAMAPDRAAAIDATHERRVIQDEDTGWASSRLEMQSRIKRIKDAGFNIYMPCVWDGAHAFFKSSIGPVSPGIRNAADPQYDPLTYLIALAHESGVAVHPWFDVVRHAPGSDFPQSFLAGAPKNAFNVHTPKFRDFIVALIVDAARRYDIDGINLDYVRAIGPCSNEECLGDYHRKYGRSLPEDWTVQENGSLVPSLIDWNRSAVTEIVRRISTGTRQAKPGRILTIDTVPFDHDRLHQGLDEEGWLRAGLIDAMIDMSYEDPIDIDTLDRAMRTFTPARQVVAIRDYDLFGATAADRSGEAMSDYVRLIRARWPGAGIAFYHYPHLSTEQITSLRGEVFARAATAVWAR